MQQRAQKRPLPFPRTDEAVNRRIKAKAYKNPIQIEWSLREDEDPDTSYLGEFSDKQERQGYTWHRLERLMLCPDYTWRNEKGQFAPAPYCGDSARREYRYIIPYNQEEFRYAWQDAERLESRGSTWDYFGLECTVSLRLSHSATVRGVSTLYGIECPPSPYCCTAEEWESHGQYLRSIMRDLLKEAAQEFRAELETAADALAGARK